MHKYPLMVVWLNILWYIHPIEYYVAMKRMV